ncbi:Glu-tRNA(Gln) amidotransferase subunit GatD [Candidatus Woesearchaeota archaeon]|nr:Glu-tRNA(Gln) amidotransferase subunit GatD [Candidatus Woesearchaeota archaeon]
MHKPGDKVEVETVDGIQTGIVMPNENAKTLFLKLTSGYNVGIDKKKIKTIDILEAFKETKKETKETIKENKKLPTIAILHTGGTIASQVDYRTGAVVSRFTAEDLLKMVPELKDIANIETRTVFQMFSEDMEPTHWSILAEKVAEELKHNPKGIIIGIGTDTLEYAASALSFALRNLSIPVLLVGSQRSSDRPSSDAGINLLCAAQFIAKTDFAGVGVCMHDNEDDNNCLIIEGNFVKKMHTSRRDTFRPINRKPLARVDSNGKIEYLRNNYPKAGGKFELKSKFSNKVGLIKIYPGFRKEELDYYENNCDGLVIEGYAFGQMPVNVVDESTKDHAHLLERVKKIAKKMPVAVVSQRPYGITYMNVYSTGRDLIDASVVEAKVLPHVAYAKLSWLLGQTKDIALIRKEMASNLVGEIVDRVEKNTFLI